MSQKTLFLRWIFMLSIILMFTAWVFSIGYFQWINKVDATKISFLIMAVFAVMTVYCGVLTWEASKLLDKSSCAIYPADLHRLYKIENQIEHGSFAINLCEKLGLTGTILGLIFMLVNGFSKFKFGDPQAMAQLWDILIFGLATAFVTTLVGIVCSILLGFQYHSLATAIKGVKK